MTTCTECGNEMARSIKPEHLEDLGGIVVLLRNAVFVDRCETCDEEETTIPNMKGLVCAAALARMLNPIRLSGKEIKFIRRALGLTQKTFAERMDVAIETISRWENDAQGCGGFTEKTLRHNACALLHKHAPAIDFDHEVITSIKFEPPQEIEPIVLERVRVKMPCQRFDGWDLPLAA